MKSILRFHAKPLYTVAFLSIMILFLVQCNDAGKSSSGADQDKQQGTSAVSDVKSFEQSPPIAQQIFIKKLKEPDNRGNTIVVRARFSEAERRLKNLTQFSIKLSNNEEVVFSDDGKNGDEKRDDGVFSAPIKVKEEELVNLVKRNNEIIERKQKAETFFISRSAVTRKLTAFNLDEFDIGRPVLFDLPFFSIVNAATLPNIRDKSLMIRDVSVVEDISRTYDPCRTPNKGNPNGAWTFRKLITNMATGVTPEQFVIDWVDNFLFSAHSLPSGDAATNRLFSKERLVKAWMKNSGLPVPAAAGVPAGWQTLALKVEEFPVRLMSIVNRLDLRGNSGYGGFNNAGEGRFVFCFVDSRAGCTNGNNGPGTMTFIFEYGVPLKSCTAIKDYATKWWNLRNMPSGNAFNAALEGITNVFTAANAKPSNPNGSALNHLRSNDFLRPVVNIAQDPWDIRDFVIDGATHKLKIVHPNKEPMESSNGFGTVPVNALKLASLTTFANSILFDDINPVYTIPATLQGIHAPMRILPAARYHWKGNAANVMSPVNRREFSFNTCSGCHKGETNNPFTHIRPRNVGIASALSGFMTGLGTDDNFGDVDADPAGSFFVNDPGPTPLPQKAFNEALRRAIDLEQLIFNSPCFVFPNFPQNLIAIQHILTFRPINMEH